MRGHIIVNGGIRESDMNELWDELCCLCHLSISKDSRKRKRFHGTSCTKATAILANLTTSLVSQTNSRCIGSCFSHFFTGYTEGYTRLRTGVEWHQKVSVDSKKISPRFFPGENTSLCWQYYQTPFSTAHTKRKKWVWLMRLLHNYTIKVSTQE